jgi:hypothetical protein
MEHEPTLMELHEALQELIRVGDEMRRRFNDEMNALHEQTRAVEQRVLDMLVRQGKAEGAAKS